MIHWMRDVPDKWGHYRVKAECSVCGEQGEHVLACETGATTSAVQALQKLGWLAFDVELRTKRRLKTVGVCPACAEGVPWLWRAVRLNDKQTCALCAHGDRADADTFDTYCRQHVRGVWTFTTCPDWQAREE